MTLVGRMIELAETIREWLFYGGASLSMMFIGVILLSYLLEDLAIVSAAALAVEQLMPASLALVAIFIGISSGDFGLYLLGKAAQRIRFLRYRLFRYQRARRVKRQLRQNAFMSLFIIRFIPGLRTLGFSLSGFLDVPKWQFFIAVITATALWTAVIFGSFFQLGSSQWVEQSQYSWLLIPVGLCLMWLVNKLITKTLLRGTYDATR